MVFSNFQNLIPRDIKKYVIDCLNTASDEEINCYIPVLVKNFRYDEEPYPLVNMIMNRTLKCNKNLYDLYWEIIVQSNGEKYKNLSN